MPKLPRGLFKREGRSGYYCRIYSEGRERWVSLGADQRVARERFRRMRGEDQGASPMSVKEAANLWLKQHVALQRSDRYSRITAGGIGKHLVPALGMKPIARLVPEDCRTYRIELERKGLSPRTVVHQLADLRCLLRWAVDSYYLSRTPFPSRLLPRIAQGPPDRLSERDVDTLTTLPEPWGFYLRLLLGTGLRWGEACRAEAVHVERGMLMIPVSKSGRVRRVPVHPELMAEIRVRVGRLLPRQVSGSFNRTVRTLSGIEGFHVHQTRHTFACRYLEDGGTLHVLQQILGHASVVTTQRYASMSESAVQSEAARLWGTKTVA